MPWIRTLTSDIQSGVKTIEIKFKMEYFRSIYNRYQEASSLLKEKMLDEFCRICGYKRKYAIYKLNDASPQEKTYSLCKAGIKRRRAKVYSQQMINILEKTWQVAGYVCSTRLKALLPLWMPWIEKYFQLTTEIKKQMLQISSRQIDRRLRPYKFKIKRRIYGGTKPGSLLKHHIPIKTDHWDVKIPGFTEVDTVSHSGNNADGTFAYSVNQTDILTGWVETRAVLGKGERGVLAALQEMMEAFPFPILGIDSDNGSEFINYHLYEYCRQKNIQFTRGRPYKKDDNAHIEQKNWTHVRKLMGWDRYDTSCAVDAMNNLYKQELRIFMNLFLPSTKILKKEQIGSKKKRKYDTPKTPFDRVIDSKNGDQNKIERLQTVRKKSDPFVLSKIIDKKLAIIIKKANCHYSSKQPTGKDKKGKGKLSAKDQEALNIASKMLGVNIHGSKLDS